MPQTKGGTADALNGELSLNGGDPAYAPPPDEIVATFGRSIFQAIGKELPSTFNQRYWSGQLMRWSLTQPQFKVNLFRLVDVLPTLTSSAAITQHVTEYLAPAASKLHPQLGPVLERLLQIPPHSLRAQIVAYLVRKGVHGMARQFIAGESARDALEELRRVRGARLAFTVDLLGEYSLSEREAEAYLHRYLDTLEVLGSRVPTWNESAPILPHHPTEEGPVCISVKLSALYSQCSVLNFARSVEVLRERLTTLARKAREARAFLYCDAEDVGTNPMIYAAFKQVFGSLEFRDFPYPGVVVQAYAKQSEGVIRDLLEFAKTRGNPIAIRLVKGAYYDHELVNAEQNGLPSPLFRKKESSDAHFEFLSRLLLDHAGYVLPAFGSHNVRSLAHACCYAEQLGLTPHDFELQMLYGMAEPIARAFRSRGYLVRLYVPLGEMLPGMGYLVRRLLENTSNESFLKHTFFDSGNVSDLLRAPVFSV